MAALFAASIFTAGFAKENFKDCDALSRPGFFEEMQYLSSTSERCIGHCSSSSAVVGGKVAVQIFSDHLTEEEYEDVKDGVAWALSTITDVIGDKVEVQLADSIVGDYETKIIVFIVTDTLDRALIKEGLPGLSADEYVFPHREVLIEGACSARVFTSEKDDRELISLSYVFVSDDAVDSQTSLDYCLLEEITHSFGLFGDPVGSASLFDNGNVDSSTSRPGNSLQTNAMLRYLYSGSPMSEEGFSAYWSKLCG